MEEVLHFVFGMFGNVTALFLFLSPILPFWRIIKNKSTEDFSGIPYTTTLLNCLLSAWYGLPFVSPNNTLVWTINGTGAVIEAVYVMIFLAYAAPRMRVKMMCLLAMVCTIFGIVALVSVFALHGTPRKFFCGVAATAVSICMYASPLSIMKLVITTKSVEFMPLWTSVFVFLCGTSWFIYGLLGRDPFITVPNGCGSALGAAQLILYAIYRKNRGPATGAVEINDKLYSSDAQNAQKGNQHQVAVPVDAKV